MRFSVTQACPLKQKQKRYVYWLAGRPCSPPGARSHPAIIPRVLTPAPSVLRTASAAAVTRVNMLSVLYGRAVHAGARLLRAQEAKEEEDEPAEGAAPSGPSVEELSQRIVTMEAEFTKEQELRNYMQLERVRATDQCLT